MADYTSAGFSRPGQKNLTGATDEMFLKLFSGEVLASFERATVMQGKVRERTISGQKSAQFPMIGRASTTGYHAAGEEIVPGQIANNEKIIDIEGLMYASTFVDDWEDMVNHYEVRSAYAKELGATLGFTYDSQLLKRLILTAREANALYAADNTQKPATAGDNQIVNAKFTKTGETGAASTGNATDIAEKADALSTAIFEANAKFDEAYVPETQEKFCILRPKDYYDLLSATQDTGFSVINRDYNGAGSYADGTVLKIGGITILKSPNLPSDANTGITDAKNINYYHQGDFEHTVGVIFSSDAIGVVRLMGLGVQTDYQVHRQGTIMVARQSIGIGALRPECVIELSTETVA